jgi:hypothetical protein
MDKKEYRGLKLPIDPLSEVENLHQYGTDLSIINIIYEENKMPEEQPTLYDIWIYIKLDTQGLASDDEFDLRGELEDSLLDHDLEISGAGSGAGWMDISLKTHTPDEAMGGVIDVLSDYEVMYRSEIGLSQSGAQDCNRKHAFKPGDALSFQFADGDYGAVLVIDRGKMILPWRDETLVGVLDYKSPAPPSIAVFKDRQWLKTTRAYLQGQGYFAWLEGCGPERFRRVDEMILVPEDITRCQFHYDWALLAEIVLRERER